MALQYKLDGEAFGKLEEGQQALYKQEGNVYLLDVQGIGSGGEDDIAKLKEQNERLLTEKKELKRKADEEAEAARSAAEEKAKKAGDFEQLYKAQQEENERLQASIAEVQQKSTQERIRGEAAKLAGTLTKDVTKASLLTEKLEARLKLTDDGIKVTDESGNLTVSTVEDLAANIKTTFPFLVDGSQASGGAAQGSGGAGDSQKQVSRSEFDGMDQSQRADHFKSGGTVIDD